MKSIWWISQYLSLIRAPIKDNGESVALGCAQTNRKFNYSIGGNGVNLYSFSHAVLCACAVLQLSLMLHH